MTTAITADEATPGGRTTGAAPSAARRRGLLAWLGLLPFLAFLVVFLLFPTYGIVRKAFEDAETGGFTWSGITDAITDERAAFVQTIKISLVSAAIGVVLGTLLAYAAATAKRPRWLRSAVSAFSGVAANMGGVVLAFALKLRFATRAP